MRTLAIVPALNESATVGQVVRSLLASNLFDVLVVDDGSHDATATIAKEGGAFVARFPANLGVGAAVRSGLVAAREAGYQKAFQFDADGQHDPDSVAGLLAALDDHSADLVIGSRFLSPGYEVSRPRRIAMAIVRGVVRSATGLQLSDPSSGFRAFSRRAIELLADIYPTDYMDSVESVVLAHRTGLAVVETPARMEQRSHGRSSASALSASWHTVRALFAVYAGRRTPRQRHLTEERGAK